MHKKRKMSHNKKDFTACIRRMGKVIFSVCLSVHTWGVPHPVDGSRYRWGVPRIPPVQVQAGVPPSRYRSSIACTYYAVVGVPLALTQEDFLVYVTV